MKKISLKEQNKKVLHKIPSCTKLRKEIETQRTKRNETKRNEILRNATKYTKMRNETQRNEIY